MALKREGKLEEAKEELRRAKLLEKAAVQQGAQAFSTSTATTAGDFITLQFAHLLASYIIMKQFPNFSLLM